MAYTYLYTSAGRVEQYSGLAAASIPDVIAEDGEDLVDQWLLDHGISPTGITVSSHIRMAATFYICYLLQKADKISIRGSDISSESGGGVSLSYVAPPKPKDWKALAEEQLELYLGAYTTDQPRKVSMTRRNYEVEEWEEIEKVTTTTKTS